MSKRISVLVLTSLAMIAGLSACTAKEKAPAAPVSELDKTMYTLGLALGSDLKRLELTEAEVDMVSIGLKDGILGKEPVVNREEYTEKLNELARERMMAAVAREREASVAFLATQAALPGAKQSESGVVYIEQLAGSGAIPGPTDSVTVHYTGSLSDGTVFDSSVERGEPATFPLNRVIPCWTEGLQNMQVGAKATLVCPPDTAYGDRGSPPTIPPASVLRFEVELLEIQPAEAEATEAEEEPKS
jgi:FKBP-type peptidyl-prolyl cis-trans isomerase FkpA/FKBP-type peptidyl-prolyl cis-trans isomerase FklB